MKDNSSMPPTGTTSSHDIVSGVATVAGLGFAAASIGFTMPALMGAAVASAGVAAATKLLDARNEGGPESGGTSGAAGIDTLQGVSSE